MSLAYQYKVRDPLGKLLEGSILAASEDEATQLLRRDGFQVLTLEGEDDGPSLFAPRISRADIIYATAQLAIMVDTGITLSSALEGIASQERNPTLRKLLNDLRQQVEGGEDFSHGLGRYPKYFDKTYIALVKSAEHTGSLAEMLEHIANYLRKEMETRGKVKAALAYPSVMAALAVAVTIFLLTFVLPKFEPLFKRKGAELPAPTVVMMTVSESLIGYWYVWVGAIVALAIGFMYARKTEPGRKYIDLVKLHLPIMGGMFRKVVISRSLRTLGTMVQSGVSMLDALRLSAEVSGNYHYEKVWLRVLDRVTQGDRVVDALRNDPLFPPTLVQMIGAGEETGKLEHVLTKVSNYYDQEVDTSIKTVTSLIEPIMITVMGVVVGGIGMALLLPIFTLSRGG